MVARIRGPVAPKIDIRDNATRETAMNMENFSESITINGEIYEYDPNGLTALIPCENCGHMNVVDVNEMDGEYFPSSFSCENCGHWNSFD
jgi:lysyl-tRNA synthetase class I